MNNKDGKFDKGRYTSIPETKNIKLPIGGKIRLGIRVKNEQGKEYPKETDHFVCPKEVRDVFGEEPTELTVFFPSAHREEVFPQNYEKYGSNEALQCQGDGEESAQRLNLENGSWRKVKCPCEHYNKKYDKKTKIGGCVKAGYLKFMIPSVSIGTFYQCRVGGTVSIEECNSAFELAEKTTGGHWAMIPFRMKRVAKKLKIPGTANMKNHWVVTLEIAASTEEIRRVISGEILYLGQKKDKEYELETTGPAEGREDEAVIEPETEEEIRAREAKEVEEKENTKKDIEESRAREAQLKKDHEEGKDKIKSYKESKTIYKKRVEEEDKILQAISKKAQKAGIDSFEGLVNFALDQGIFKTQLTEHLATRVLATNKDVGDRLIKALEELSKSKEEMPKEEIPKEDKKKLLTDLFVIAQKAGLKNWEEIVGEGCRTRINDEEYVFDIPTTIEEAKEMLINDPERLKKMEEVFTTMARATN
ncbi:hypothetical protein ES705_38419 [subsurface metagenome]